MESILGPETSSVAIAQANMLFYCFSHVYFGCATAKNFIMKFDVTAEKFSH